MAGPLWLRGSGKDIEVCCTDHKQGSGWNEAFHYELYEYTMATGREARCRNCK